MLSKLSIRRLLSAQSAKQIVQQKANVASSNSNSRLATATNTETSNGQLSSQMIFEREEKYGAHNYHPMPVALARGKGIDCFILMMNLIHSRFF